MRTSQKFMSAAGLGLSAALLVGGAPAFAQSTDTPESAQASLEADGYVDVSCLAPTVEDDEAIVPAAPNSDEWLIAFFAADVGEETPYSDLIRDFVEGDRLSIVGQDLAKQPLTSVILCSAPTDQDEMAGADIEGNMGARGYAPAKNGEPESRPGFVANPGGSTDEPSDKPTDTPVEKPVVETDVPAQSSGDLALTVGAAGLVAGAGALLWSRKRQAPQR